MKHEAFDVLKSLSKEEFKKFKLFSSSPYFTKKKNLSEFLNLLSKFHPNYEDKTLTDEYLKSKLNNINESTLRNYFSDVTILLVKFMKYLASDTNSISQQILLLEELDNRNLVSSYEKQKIEFLKLINDPNLEFQITDYLYLSRFYLVEKNFFMGNLTTVKKGINSTIVELEIKIGNSLTKFYLLESLIDWIQSKTNIFYYNPDTLKRRECKLITFFEEGKQAENIFEKTIEDETNSNRKKILKTYYNIYQCYKENQRIESLCLNLDNLLKAIKNLPKNINAFEFQYIISIGRNAVAGLQRRDYYDVNLKNEFDEFYLKSFVRKGGDLTIPSHSFSDIFLGALINDQLSFAKKIFKNYKKFTNNKMYDFYGIALKFFESLKCGDFTKASILFLKLESTDINVKRKLKFLQIYLHYENGDYEYCLTLLSNLRKFIYNHSSEHSKLMVDHLINLCNSLKLLCDFRLQNDKEKLFELSRGKNFSINVFAQNKRSELLKEFA